MPFTLSIITHLVNNQSHKIPGLSPVALNCIHPSHTQSHSYLVTVCSNSQRTPLYPTLSHSFAVTLTHLIKWGPAPLHSLTVAQSQHSHRFSLSHIQGLLLCLAPITKHPNLNDLRPMSICFSQFWRLDGQEQLAGRLGLVRALFLI